MPQLTTIRLCFGDENSNDRQPAWASRLISIGGAPAGIHDQHAAAGFEPLIGGVRRVGQRRAAGFVIGEQRQQLFGRRRAHAVEMRERALGMAEEPQHRHHAIDGVEQRLRRRDVARRVRLAERQQLQQHFDDRAGIEGPIRVGKSTLAQVLADRMHARRVFDCEDNPFLAGFYKEQRGAAFAAQMYFLWERQRRLREAAIPMLPARWWRIFFLKKTKCSRI